MSILKYIERLKRMDQLIKLKATGSPTDFAIKMQISRSTLLLTLQELKANGLPIKYCYSRKTYIYTIPGSIKIKFEKEVLNKEELKGLFGGNNEDFIHANPFLITCQIY